MKLLRYTSLFFLLLLICGCEDAIGVDTKTQAPKIVVDAPLEWQKGTAGNEQTIKLTTTSNYFDSQVPPLSGVTVYVRNSLGTQFDFVEDPGTGIYRCTAFIPEITETYTLTVISGNTVLTATETLTPVPPIETVIQTVEPGIGTDQDQIEVRAIFTDDGSRRDFYLHRTKPSNKAIPELNVFDDEFFNGNPIFALYFDPDLVPGTVLDITLAGVSERYYNYLTVLISIAGQFTGGPFSTAPATLHGNIYNTTNPDNYALGYFSVSETDRRTYTVE